jgi:hypothetical protein
VSSKHLCHAVGCKRPCPPRMLMCKAHWRIVPKALQDAVWATYRPGQETTKTPSDAYLAAAQAAIDAVAAKEQKTEPDTTSEPACQICHQVAQLHPWGRDLLCAGCLPGAQAGLARMARARIDAGQPLTDLDYEAIAIEDRRTRSAA